MTKRMIFMQAIVFVLAWLALPFLLLLSGCYTQPVYTKIPDRQACGQDDCGKDPK